MCDRLGRGASSGKRGRGDSASGGSSNCRPFGVANACLGHCAGTLRRRALHAGSWYSKGPVELRRELDGYLADVDNRACRKSGVAKGLVSPHAGYRFSGPTAAWGFSSIDPSVVRRVFVLGPSHHLYLTHCALPSAGMQAYLTPLGPIALDQEILTELRRHQEFKEVTPEQDEHEHSIEMQLPFLQRVMGEQTFTLVPLVVGNLDPKNEKRYGELLAPYFDLPDTFFIISSDFCHWGPRFDYCDLPQETPVVARTLPQIAYPAKKYPVNGSIEALDRRGMHHIALKDLEAFRRYLDSEKNTICGRHPICVFLEILKRSHSNCDVSFLHYSQSQLMPVEERPTESCVSYASGVCWKSPA